MGRKGQGSRRKDCVRSVVRFWGVLLQHSIVLIGETTENYRLELPAASPPDRIELDLAIKEVSKAPERQVSTPRTSRCRDNGNAEKIVIDFYC